MISTIHHVGCLVPDIDAAIADYRILHPSGEVSEIYDITDQKVKVCFFAIGNTNVEFVSPYGEESSLSKMLKKSPGFYHIGVYTDNIDKEIERLEGEGYRMINKFTSSAFNNRYCAFLLNNEFHLIELIESLSPTLSQGEGGGM